MSRRNGSALFGRDDDLAKLGRLFEAERLVTLTGPGGIGKTSLAVRFSEGFASSCFVDWSDVRDKSAALVALAHALGARGGAGETPMSSIETALAKATPDLLVLDNCEQIIDDAAAIVALLLRSVGSLRILATSREILNVEREASFPLEPLSVVAAANEASPAVELFVDRARRARPSYTYGADERFVGEIVQKLEGIPLAIELAAARMAILDAKGVLDRLDAPLELLRGGPRSAPERQRTLRAAILGSWTPLSTFERSTLAQCSVFRGGFTIDAAEHVVRLEGSGAPPILDLLQSLAQQSLLRTTSPTGFPDEVRFLFFESIRELAAEKLADSACNEAEHARAAERHRAYFLETGSQWEASHWHGGIDSVRRLALERENLLEARAHAMNDSTPEGAIDLIRSAIALHPIFSALGPLSGSPALLDRARIDASLTKAPVGLRARFYLVRGRAEQMVGERERSRADFEQALTHAREAKDDRLEARALVHLATADRAGGNFNGARDRFEAALRRFEACGDEAAASVVLSALGALDLQSGDLEKARLRVARAADIQRAHNDRATLGMMLIDLGIIEQELGRFSDARARLEEAQVIHGAIDNRRFLAVATGYLANLDLEQGNTDAAARGYRAATEVLGPIGDLKFESLFGAALASIDGGRAAFDAIEARALGRLEPRIAAAISLHRARHDWVLEVLQSPNESPGADARRRAEDKRAATAGLQAESDDVRFALRLLDRAMGRAPEAVSPAHEPVALWVARDGSSFRAPGEGASDLSRRESARRILLALVRRRIEAPGQPVSASELIDAGWPGERMNEAAAKNRLHVTLTKLRESGLRKLIVSRDGGHLIDPDVNVVVDRD